MRVWAKRASVWGLLLGMAAGVEAAEHSYSDRVLFENSRSVKADYYTRGQAQTPSVLTLIHGKLPVEREHFLSPPDSLRLEWTSKENGGWQAGVDAYVWRNRLLHFSGSELRLHLFAPEGIAAADLPRIALEDADHHFTAAVDLGSFAGDVAKGEWREVRIPVARLKTASVAAFAPERTLRVVFAQGRADGRPHTLFVDDITFDDPPGASRGQAPAVGGVAAEGFERHVDVSWKPAAGVARYEIYRAREGEAFRAVGTQMPGINRYADFVGSPGVRVRYQVRAVTADGVAGPLSGAVAAETHAMTDDELMTMVERASFRYYWEHAHPDAGMALENVPGNDDIVATGASGFGIMATVVAADRGFITHGQAVGRLLQITDFLNRADRYHGVWPHFLNGHTGKAMPVFDLFDNGADLVETSFLMEGLLTARQYFKGDGAEGAELYRRISKLWEGVEWEWFETPGKDALWWHWSPEYSWAIHNRLTGWNEVMITYLLAIASPTHGVPAGLLYSGYVGEAVQAPYANGKKVLGIELPVGEGVGGPLFFTHYSYMGFDAHGFSDKYANYFENNRAIARINEAYCEANPKKFAGYGADEWGITAVDGPEGYVPYEPTPALDDGTIAPTGAIASMVYTPEASMRALKHFYRDLGAQVWGEYGFRDAFNQEKDWTSGIYMGLNQAPQVVMIENARTGLVWKNFMANAEAGKMLAAARR